MLGCFNCGRSRSRSRSRHRDRNPEPPGQTPGLPMPAPREESRRTEPPGQTLGVPVPVPGEDSSAEPSGQTPRVPTPGPRKNSGTKPLSEIPTTSKCTPTEKTGLFILNDRETAAADVVAIHGLCGDPFETWTEDTSNKLWLRDFLPSQVPNTRIMSFGFDSEVAFSKSEVDLSDVATDLLNRLNGERDTSESANRPVIFICHSFGGIVVKKALILAHERSGAYGALLESTKAVIFMGTPHGGTGAASWADCAARVLKALQMGTATNQKLLSDLRRNSEALWQVSQQFVERASTLQIKTFYETRKLDYMNGLIVEKASAILNLPSELSAPISADHRSMCKFASKDEQKYRPVWKAVKHLVDRVERGKPLDIDRVAKQTLLSIMNREGSDQLLGNLQAVDQEGYQSRAKSLVCDHPKFYWIFKDMDFGRWQSTKASGAEVLWLSGPPECDISVAASHIVDQAKRSHSRAQHSVLYFFCATAPSRIPVATTFACTIVRQLACCSPELKETVATMFLQTLLEEILWDESRPNAKEPLFNVDDSAEVVVKRILKASSSDACWSALRAVVDTEPEQGLSIIVDGLHKTEHQNPGFVRELGRFIDHLRERPSSSTTRVLLTSRPQTKVKGILDRLPCIEYDRERKDCLNRLRFENTRYEKISEQHEGSLEWLWANQDYLAWSSAASSDLLLIEGKPGSGKSTLMKYFQRSLQDQEPPAGANEGPVVASFYYSYREGEKQTNHCNMLRSVLYDVLNQNEEFFFHFQSYYRQVAQGGGHSWSYESLKKILLSLANKHPVRKRLYLIVDAVDESDGGDERIDVIKLLHEVCIGKGSCIVKVFVASRPVTGLSAYLTEHHKVIRLQDFNKSDIMRFAESFLRGPELDLPPSIAHPAMEYIAGNAQGVFVWVHLVREELFKYARDGCSEDEVFDFLKSLPTELEGIYQRILCRLEGGEKRDLKVGQRMLQFVLFAYRPLGLDELRQALAIRGDLEPESSLSDDSFQRGLIHKIERRLISCAGNFLEVKARGDYGKNKIVQIMHQTVREFFRPEGPAANSRFRISSKDIHIRMSITCIRYLMLCTTKAAVIDQAAGSRGWTSEHFKAYAEYLSKRPFFNYAREYGQKHLLECGQVAGIPELISSFRQNLNKSSAAYILQNWIPQASGEEQQGYGRNFRAELLHAATRMKYSQVVEALLIAGAEIEACIDGKTPLMVAAESGDMATARILLDRGADTGAKGGKALHLAAANGYSAAVGLLIDRGAEKEARDDKKQTAMHLAAANGHGPVVGLLIDRGAEREARDDKKQTAMHLAAANGHGPVVGLLIDRGAEREARDYKKQTAMHLAAANGHGPVVGLLIDRGAEREARDDKKQTAMHLAAANGHGPVVGLLIDRGAEREARDDKKQTAMHLAAANGHGPVVGLLIDRGAEREARDDKKQTAMHLAAANGHSPVVGLLIDRGANKEAEEGEKQTALHLAAANGHNPVIGLLLDREANKEARDIFGWQALHTAAWNGQEATIKILVRNFGAGKEEPDECGWTALHVAAMNGCGTACRWLIEHLGADTEAKGRAGWTALHFVAAIGLEETTQLLIKTLGVNRDARTKKGETAQDLAQK